MSYSRLNSLTLLSPTSIGERKIENHPTPSSYEAMKLTMMEWQNQKLQFIWQSATIFRLVLETHAAILISNYIALSLFLGKIVKRDTNQFSILPSACLGIHAHIHCFMRLTDVNIYEFTQHLHSSRMLHKVNLYAEFNWFDFRVPIRVCPTFHL